MRPNPQTESANKQKPIPTVSTVFEDGAILEMAVRPEERCTAFVLWRDDQWTIEPGITVGPLQRLVPYSPNNNLIKNEVVLFPSKPEEYGSEAELVSEIQSFIHVYKAVDEGLNFADQLSFGA